MPYPTAPANPVVPTANSDVPWAWCWVRPKPPTDDVHDRRRIRIPDRQDDRADDVASTTIVDRRAAVIIGIMTNPPPMPARLPRSPAIVPIENERIPSMACDDDEDDEDDDDDSG